MSSSLLKTKTYVPPPRANLVHRPRLTSRLSQDVSQKKLTLLSAPAGFGKTTLLSDWVPDCGRPVAWVSLDETDSDPSRFWAYLIAAMQTIEPNVGDAALVFCQAPQPQAMDPFLTALINDIADKMSPFLMVLDDYHTVTSQQINEGIEFLIDHMPPHMHIVISGRADPPLSLARLRARNQLCELRAADLRFTLEEATAFLKDVMKLRLSGEQVAALAERTEGWVASLQMAGISLEGRQDAPDFVARFSGSHRFVLDYLTDEVLSQLDEDIRTFLLQTSILRRMSSALCDAVTRQQQGAAMLQRLEAANLFVEPLDEERRWYRYHQLFAELLVAQLARSYPSEEADLHQRASSWFEHEGSMEEAIYHALAARDFDKSADLIEGVAASLIERSHVSVLLAWLGRLPEAVIAKRPWLCICNAWALLLGGQFDRVEAVLQAAERGIEAATVPSREIASERFSTIEGHALTIRSYIARARGDIPRSIALSSEAAGVLPPNETRARSANALSLSIAYRWTGDLINASKHSRDAHEIASAGSNLYVALESLCTLGTTQMERGHLHEAAETFQRAIKLGKEWGGGHPLPATATAYNGLGHLHYEWNQLESALRFVEQGIELSEAAGLWHSGYAGYATLILIKHALGDADAAMEGVGRLMKRYPPGTTVGIYAASWKGRLLLARNEIDSLRQWVSSGEIALDATNMPDYWNEMPYLVLAAARIALGEVGQLPELLRQLADRAEAHGRTNNQINISALAALALMADGHNDDALGLLQKALSLARPEVYIRTFVDHGPAMKLLLRQAARSSAAKGYIHQLLDAFPSSGSGGMDPVNPPEASHGEHLNQREREILRLMAAGLSNPKIAAQVYLSLNTVKWYTRGIYGKLGVAGRAEAVNRARDLGIL